MYEVNTVERWYALRVKSRHEKCVSLLLRSKDYEVFLPLYRTRRRWADRIASVELPLFGGYTFCRFAAVERSSILATPGIVDVVRIGAVPAPIDADEIAALRRVVESRLRLEVSPELIAGQRCRMLAGPLAGLEGLFVRACRGPRLVLSVTLLQQSVLVEIDRDWVMPLHPLYPDSGLLVEGSPAC